MPKVAKKIQKTCELLKEFSVIPLFDVTGLEAVQCGYKEDNTPPASGWQPMTYLVGEHTHYWVRGKFRTPAAEPNYRYMLNFHTGVSGWDAMNPQGLLYLNGKMVQGLDTNHMEAFLEPDQEYEMYIYFYTGVANGPFPLDITVVKLDPQTEGLYYDLEVPREALDFLLERNDALIIESFGVGGLPETGGFHDSVRRWTERGKTVVLTTQVQREGSDVAVYHVGHRLKEDAGVLEAYDMTTEAVLAKLMWILGRTRDPEEVRRLFYTPVERDLLWPAEKREK